jgi:uncharacterized protein YodC (DUF2158 family)
MTFQPGDLVQLRPDDPRCHGGPDPSGLSARPPMTVLSNVGGEILCTWLSGRRERVGSFPPADLVAFVDISDAVEFTL